MRALSLRYWMGSEFDITVIRREQSPSHALGLTKIFHIFNERSDKTLKIISKASWDSKNCWHMIDGKTNYLQIISYLLTYYNGVFLDDTIDEVAPVYFQNPWAKQPGDILKIGRSAGRKTTYKKK